GRRLLAERIALVCAARTGSGDHVLNGLEELQIGGLASDDAHALLMDNLHAPLDEEVEEQIIAESHRKPPALLELPRTWNNAGTAGGVGPPLRAPGLAQVSAR